MYSEIEKKLKEVLKKVPVFGFHGISLLDYPSTVASIIYTGYCNLKCPYCQNPTLLDPIANKLEPMPAGYFVEEITKRKKLVKGVVVTGGEPTMHQDLCELLDVLKNDLGLKVKLDTNGLFPERLQEAVDKKLVDYIAMDFKTVPNKYNGLGIDNTIDVSEKLAKSVDIITKSSIDYEIRVTAVPSILDEGDAEEIAKIVSEAKKVYIQQFVPENSLEENMKETKPYSVEQLKIIAEKFKKKAQVFMRGI